MKIRVYPTYGDNYNAIVIDTDKLPILSNRFHTEPMPTFCISDLIERLIDEN